MSGSRVRIVSYETGKRVVLGRFFLNGGGAVQWDVTDAAHEAAMKALAADEMMTADFRIVAAKDEPGVWLAALPANRNGSYFWAEEEPA